MSTSTTQDNPADTAEPGKTPGKKYFYGWNIVGVMAASAAVNMALGTLNFGFFINPMGQDLGIGRSVFGWATTGRQVTSAATSPYVGRLLDRYGSRIMLPVAVLITAGAMVGLAYSHSSWHLIVLFCVMGLVGMSGPGALVNTVPVLKWFVRKRGKAIAFAGLGIPIGSLIFVPLTQQFIDMWGWRTTWIVLAAIGAGIMVPLAAVVLRRQPEDMGLLPDGASPVEMRRVSSASGGPSEDEESWTVAEARKTFVFWKLVIVFSLVALGVGTVGVHRIPAFEDRGIASSQIAIATAFDAVAAGISTFTMGMLATRIHPRYLGAAGFMFLAGASVLTIYANNIAMVFASMWIFGMGIGGMMFLQNYIWADFFGRANLGAIRGWVMPITLFAGAAGAPTAGYVYDATGTYDQIWWAGVAFMAFGALIVAFSTAPQKPTAPSSPLASAAD